MASRLFAPSLRAFRRTSSTTAFAIRAPRHFQTSAFRQQDAVAAAPMTPVRKPVGAFRGGVFGFLLGSTLAGLATWYYIMEEYRVSNELLTEDIYVRERDPIDEVYERVAI